MRCLMFVVELLFVSLTSHFYPQNTPLANNFFFFRSVSSNSITSSFIDLAEKLRLTKAILCKLLDLTVCMISSKFHKYIQQNNRIIIFF